jgi:hypothetical protein
MALPEQLHSGPTHHFAPDFLHFYAKGSEVTSRVQNFFHFTGETTECACLEEGAFEKSKGGFGGCEVESVIVDHVL